MLRVAFEPPRHEPAAYATTNESKNDLKRHALHDQSLARGGHGAGAACAALLGLGWQAHGYA